MAEHLALLAEYASGSTDVQRALQRLAASGSSSGGPSNVTAHDAAPGMPAVLAGLPASVIAAASDRHRLCQHLHRLLYLEAVLGQLMQRCEDTSDGLEATAQVLRIMSKGLDEVGAYFVCGVGGCGGAMHQLCSRRWHCTAIACPLGLH